MTKIKTNRYYLVNFLAPLYEGIAESEGYADELFNHDLNNIDDLKDIINKYLKPFFKNYQSSTQNENLKYSLYFCLKQLDETELRKLFYESYAMIEMPENISYYSFFLQLSNELFGDGLLNENYDLEDINDITVNN